MHLDHLTKIVSLFDIVKRLSSFLKKNPEASLQSAMRSCLGEGALKIALDYVSNEDSLTVPEKIKVIDDALSKFVEEKKESAPKIE